jgi:acyl-coenzyme A synthetase/AMP-(fatty) acid ligase
MIADEAGAAVAAGDRGELCLSGAQVTRGYLDEEKNQTAFFNHGGHRWYRTGDIAFMRADGNYIYCGRLDQQVKVQGFRVELGEVEHHIRSLYNCNVVAVIKGGSQGMSQIEVIIEGPSTDKDIVRGALKERLPYYMLPAEIHFMSPFPLNVNGKTDRKSIAAMIADL